MTEIVTLRHVMEKTPLGKARLLAGEAGLDKEVRETNIIEVPDTFRWMRGGEILFSAGYAFGGDGAQGAELIGALVKRRITALVLKPGKYMPVVPREMITRADQLGFPLLEMPEDMPYSVCMEAAYDLLKDSRLFELRMADVLWKRTVPAFGRTAERRRTKRENQKNDLIILYSAGRNGRCRAEAVFGRTVRGIQPAGKRDGRAALCGVPAEPGGPAGGGAGAAVYPAERNAVGQSADRTADGPGDPSPPAGGVSHRMVSYVGKSNAIK